MSNFHFMEKDFPRIADSAMQVERYAMEDPRVACFYARRCIELFVGWLYRHERQLNKPYTDKLGALLHDSSFEKEVPQKICTKLGVLRVLGNKAVHSGKRLRQYDALQASQELFHCCFWLFSRYSRSGTDGLKDVRFEKSFVTGARGASADREPADEAVSQFLVSDLMEDKAVPPKTGRAPLGLAHAPRGPRWQEKIKRHWDLALEADAGFSAEDSAQVVEGLQKEFGEAKKKNIAAPVEHDYSEDKTRELFIDLLLRESGWDPDFKEGEYRTREFEVKGMPNATGVGRVDYVLWSREMKPLAIIEAKRTRKEAREGRNQAKLYADCIEEEHGQRPVIFYTNGYEHWIWDDLRYPERRVQGFLTEDELELIIQRRRIATDLSQSTVNKDIAGRYFQEQAIRNLAEAFTEGRRKGLLVMATGSGKTRTAVALVDLLQRAGWVKRVLFLADRVALVKQAVNAFKEHLPQSSPVNLVTEKESTGSGVYVSTYPTMMSLMDESGEGRRRFGTGHFDLVIIDEAHRSVYRKYRAVFDYFDSFLVGLTATPRSEVDRDTYALFDLTAGVPTYYYELEKAVEDQYLVPPRLVSVPLKFPREGIRYDDLADEEKDQWDMTEWNEDGTVPEEIDPAALNQWLFNTDTVDKVLEHVMRNGLRVDAGQMIGKTIIFAKNHKHAHFIQERFDVNYPHLKGTFARVIDNKERYANELIEKFSAAGSTHADAPQIAISVDMLDTGIDVPDLVNLVFFKRVRSRTKFWQMIGRGTRLCSDLFGEAVDKEFFFVFDFCANFEFFNENPQGVEGNTQEPVDSRIFRLRLDLLKGLRAPGEGADSGREGLADGLVDALSGGVGSMDPDNFIVRPKRQEVLRFSKRKSWEDLSDEDYATLHGEVAPLPTVREPEHPSAKWFDVLILKMQLALLNNDPSLQGLISRVSATAAKLEGAAQIPEVAAQMELIGEVQEENFWKDVTLPGMELVRGRLRGIVRHVPRGSRKIIETHFEDQIGESAEVRMAGISDAVDRTRYKRKFNDFLKKHTDHIVIKKLKYNEPLTAMDLEELEGILFDAGDLGGRREFEDCYGEQKQLGVFIRELVGLDRGAAKEAFGRYLDTTTFKSRQIDFIEMIIDHLTANGMMNPKLLFEHPFTNLSADGPVSLFSDEETGRIVGTINAINNNAVAVPG